MAYTKRLGEIGKVFPDNPTLIEIKNNPIIYEGKSSSFMELVILG